MAIPRQPRPREREAAPPVWQPPRPVRHVLLLEGRSPKPFGTMAGREVAAAVARVNGATEALAKNRMGKLGDRDTKKLVLEPHLSTTLDALGRMLGDIQTALESTIANDRDAAKEALLLLSAKDVPSDARAQAQALLRSLPTLRSEEPMRPAVPIWKMPV